MRLQYVTYKEGYTLQMFASSSSRFIIKIPRLVHIDTRTGRHLSLLLSDIRSHWFFSLNIFLIVENLLDSLFHDVFRFQSGNFLEGKFGRESQFGSFKVKGEHFGSGTETFLEKCIIIDILEWVFFLFQISFPKLKI